MWIVLFSILMDVVGYGIVSPILPFYARSLGAGPGLVTACLALHTGAMFLTTPAWGRLSDRIGRKPVLCIGLLGATVSYGLLATADSVATIALARALGGAMAGNIAAAFAYVTDSSAEADRARYMGYAGASVGVGFIIGPALGSWLGGSTFEDANFVMPALTAGALTLVALIGIVAFVQESHPGHDRNDETTANRPPLWRAIAALRHRGMLVNIVLCGALYHFAGGLYETIFPLWSEDLSLVDGPRGMFPMLAAGGAGYVLTQALLIGPLTRRFAPRTLLRGAAVGLTCSAASVTVAGGAASVPWVIVFFAAIAANAAVINTCVQTLVSLAADAHERGIILGVSSSTGTLARTIGTLLSGTIYGGIHLHAPYWSAAAVGIVLFALASTIRAGRLGSDSSEPTDRTATA